VIQERNLQYRLASEIYLNLKNNFSSLGRGSDTRWAYLQQRRMQRNSHSISFVRNEYSDEFDALRAPHRWSKISYFYIKHFFYWLLEWLADTLFGYGELPLNSLLLAGFTILGFTIGFRVTNAVGDPVSRMPATRFLDYFIYSIASFATINFARLSPLTPTAEVFTAIESLVGVATFAILMFALGNRLNRD
jgi:hypothetical protein